VPASRGRHSLYSIGLRTCVALSDNFGEICGNTWVDSAPRNDAPPDTSPPPTPLSTTTSCRSHLTKGEIVQLALHRWTPGLCFAPNFASSQRSRADRSRLSRFALPGSHDSCKCLCAKDKTRKQRRADRVSLLEERHPDQLGEAGGRGNSRCLRTTWQGVIAYSSEAHNCPGTRLVGEFSKAFHDVRIQARAPPSISFIPENFV
jgi:hypothetical protein